MLDIATDQDGHHRIYVINLRGRIDSITARDFEEFFEDMLKTGNRFFILDASRLEFVSSAGIAALVKFIRRLDAVGGATAVIRMNPEIRMLLEFFGLEEGLPEYERLEDAREYISVRMRDNKYSLEIEKDQVMRALPPEEERRQALRAKQAKLDKSREAYARPLYSDEHPEAPDEIEEEYDDEYKDEYDRPAEPRVLKLHRPGDREPAAPPRSAREYADREYSDHDHRDQGRESYRPDPGRSPGRSPSHPKKYYVQGELDVEELRSRVEQVRGGTRPSGPRREHDHVLREEAVRDYRPLREKEGQNWTHSSYKKRPEQKKQAAVPRPQLFYKDGSFHGKADQPVGPGSPSLQPPEVHHKAEPRDRMPMTGRSARMRQADVIHREPTAADQEHELVEFAEPRVLVCESCQSHLRVYHSGRHLCANPECRVEFRISDDGSVSYFEKL